MSKKMVKDTIKNLTPDEHLVLKAIVEAGSKLTTAQLVEATGLASYQIDMRGCSSVTTSPISASAIGPRPRIRNTRSRGHLT
jgi:hypothetical protein